MFNLFKDEFTLGKVSDKVLISEASFAIGSLIKDLVKEKFSSPLKLYILDSGSCNGCELELQLLFSPLYDLSSYGIEVSYDASEADVLLITGLMTENMYVEFERLHEQLKEPKEIITIGDCPVYATAFQDTFALKERVDNFFPKAFHIGGCPPEPLVLLQGLHEYLKNFEI
jgi:Ni,Fe-hydrogenase III small subunit